MQIYGPSHVHGPQAVSAPHAARVDAARQPVSTGATHDTVDISETGRLLEMAGALPAIRGDRVAQIRAELAQGAYETADKLDLALERLLDEIA